MSLSPFWISPNVHVLGPSSGGHFIRLGWDSYSIPTKKHTRTIGPVLGGSLHESCLYVGSFTVITCYHWTFPPTLVDFYWALHSPKKEESRFLSNSTLSSQLCVTLEVPGATRSCFKGHGQKLGWALWQSEELWVICWQPAEGEICTGRSEDPVPRSENMKCWVILRLHIGYYRLL